MLFKLTAIGFYFLCFFSSCNEPENKAAVEPVSDKVPAASKNSDVFNQSFEKLLVSYYDLKNAMVEYDTAAANAASREIADYANSLPTDELKTEPTGGVGETVRNFTGTIHSAASELLKKNNIPEKKKEFQVISDALYGLAGTVKYDRQIIYHLRCPMAFNDDTEAFWLSENSNIVNPYLGKKHPRYKAAMMECGEVTDSLDFSKE